MPVVVNHLGAPTPSSTPFPPTPAPSNKNSIQHIINPRPQPATVATPRKQVIATALRQPLQLGTNRLEFLLPSNFHEISTNITMGTTKVRMVNSDLDLVVFETSPGMSDLGPKWVRLGANGTDPGLFQIRF